MENSDSALTRKETKDFQVLALFTSVYCRVHHAGTKQPWTPPEALKGQLDFSRYPLCTDCREFLAYAVVRRQRCPLDPKPTCKHCDIHCYRAGHRERVREIMRFSGKYLMRRGRLDLLWHYFF